MPGPFELPLIRAEVRCRHTDCVAEFVLSGTNGLDEAIFIWDPLNLSSKVARENVKQGCDFTTRIVRRWFG